MVLKLLREIMTIIGRPHISVMPETFYESIFDFAEIGEGEETLNELFNYLFKSMGDLNSIKGLAFYLYEFLHFFMRGSFFK
jgi:radical SAM superfamily enzyme YgiQ (UPF0313 family)